MKCSVSTVSLLLPGSFREELDLTQERMFGWAVFNSFYFSYNLSKHGSTSKCDNINDTLVSVTGLNWMNSLSPRKDIAVVTMQWVNRSSSFAFELFCYCFLSSELSLYIRIIILGSYTVSPFAGWKFSWFHKAFCSVQRFCAVVQGIRNCLDI